MEHKRLKSRNDDIVKLIKNGVPLNEIAKWFDITYERVRQIGKNNGIPVYTIAEREERNRQIIQLLKEGESHKKLAERFNLSIETIANLARYSGILTPLQQKFEQRNLAIIKELKKGTSPKKAALLYKMSSTNIIMIAHKHGIRYRPLTRKPVILQMLKDGHSVSEIAEKMKVTKEIVYHYRKHHLN